MRAAVAARPRRRGGTPAAAASDSSREEVGEDEGVARELTEGSIWAEKGRERELDGEGGARGRTAMAGDGGGSISAGVGHDRARGGVEWVRGEVEQLRVRRIEARRRGTAGTRLGGGSARSARLELEEGKGRDRTGREASRVRERMRTACAEGEDRRRGEFAGMGTHRRTGAHSDTF